MEYFDTHCHLDSILPKMGFTSFDEFASAHLHHDDSHPDARFGGAVTVSCDPDSIEAVQALSAHERVYAAYGIHPHDARHYDDNMEARLREAMRSPKTVAWGEIGLDYHYNFSEPEIQRKVFERQIEQGVMAEKPLIIHTREAEQDTLAIMLRAVPSDWKVHVHCFTSSPDLAVALLSAFPNLYVGFTGVITFKTADAIRAVVEAVPLNRLLLETDGPYMAPVPHRGKTAHPGHIPFIAEKMAEIKGVEIGKLYAETRENTRNMYGI